jgi:precorrin-4 methylase
VVLLTGNCYRVDAVKASAAQLKQQLVTSHVSEDNNDTRTASRQLAAVDVEVKANDANKAELALSTAKSAIDKLVYERRDRTGGIGAVAYGSLDLRA